MKKYAFFRTVIAFALCLTVVFSFPVKFFADTDANVKYDGDAKKFVFIPGNTDLFPEFKGLMPGDVVSQDIPVKNDSDKEVKIYLKALPADTAAQNDVDFLKQLNLTVKWNGSTKYYDASPDQTAGLTNYVLLGTFKPGASGTITATLTVPATLGNEYMNREGAMVIWQFMVEEAEDKPGDTTAIVPAACAFAVCAVIVIVLLVTKKKKNKGDE